MNAEIKNAGKNARKYPVAIKKKGITLSLYIYMTFFKTAQPPADRATVGTLKGKTQRVAVAIGRRQCVDSGDSARTGLSQ